MDEKTKLESVDDAASVNWGGSWRMPTDADWTELRENCTWTWTDDYNSTSIKGYIVTASNGNSIFLPAAGHMEEGSTFVGSRGRYWSSALHKTYPSLAWSIYIISAEVYWRGYDRFCGFSVRPVQ